MHQRPQETADGYEKRTVQGIIIRAQNTRNALRSMRRLGNNSEKENIGRDSAGACVVTGWMLCFVFSERELDVPLTRFFTNQPPCKATALQAASRQNRQRRASPKVVHIYCTQKRNEESETKNQALVVNIPRQNCT